MIRVKKLDGTLENYNESKLKKSLKDAGASKETIDRVLSEVKQILHDGIETKKLFKFVFTHYRKHQPYVSSRYYLKSAILGLGKSGDVFEKYVSRIFQKKEYKTSLNLFCKGKHIKHEIDIVAKKGKEKIMVECKHHKKPWLGTSIQTALYVYARFLDVEKDFTCPMLVTNTKFSRQVIDYSKGVKLKLMGWKFPRGDSLEKNITDFKLYPVNMLRSLKDEQVEKLISKDILLIQELSDKGVDSLMKILKIPKSKAKEIIKEAGLFCEECE